VHGRGGAPTRTPIGEERTALPRPLVAFEWEGEGKGKREEGRDGREGRGGKYREKDGRAGEEGDGWKGRGGE